jgi:hypothetical protein
MKELGVRHVGPKPVSPKAKKIPELGEVVKGFDDIDKTNSDLEDEPVPLSIKVLVLSCI